MEGITRLTKIYAPPWKKKILSLAHFSYAINCPQKVIIVLIFPFLNLFLFSFKSCLFCSQWTNNISEHIYFQESSQDQRLGHFSQSWMKPGFSQCWIFFQILELIDQEHVTCFSWKTVKISILNMLLPMLDETRIGTKY